jgi:hypothetical protein
MVLEMDESAFDVVDLEGATGASLSPFGTKHEVLDDQLAPSLEEAGERALSPRAVEQIGLFHLEPGEIAALGGQAIPHPGKLFFFDQVPLVGGDPFISWHDSLVIHSDLL